MRNRESGIVLVNVLVVLALAGSIIFLLLTQREAAIDRIAGFARSADAEQIAFGAEMSVIAALQQDLERAPEADHFGEPWAKMSQRETQLASGTFSVEIRDMRARYDINYLAVGGLGPVRVLARLLENVGEDPSVATRIAAVLRRTGPVASLDDLIAFGIASQPLEALEPYVAAMPVPGTVNLNTADRRLLAAMLGNGALAARLEARRQDTGQLTREDLATAGAVRPDNSGFVSDSFLILVDAEASDARLKMQTRVIRVVTPDTQQVVVLERRIGLP